MLDILIALRNIFRNRTRTLLTMLSIVVGSIAIIIVNGFINYSMWGLRESMIRNGIGHFQFYQKGYLEREEDISLEFMITNYKKLTREIYENMGVSFVAPEISFNGVISSGEKSTIIIGKGGLSEEEQRLNSFGEIVEGSFYNDDEFAVLIGEGVAKKIKAKLGDTLTLMAPMRGGGLNAIDVTVKGIIRMTIEEYNSTIVLAPLFLAQNLLNVEGVDRLIVMLKDTEKTKEVEKISIDFARNKNLEFKSWKDLAIFFFQVRDMYNTMFLILFIIIIGVIIFSIANTMTMNVFERISEIGTIRALGAKRRHIIRQFVLESLFIGIIGGAFGLILGYLIAEIINLSGGIYIPPPPGNAKGYYSMVKPEFYKVLLCYAGFVVTCIIASIFPARKAAKMEIVEAIRG
ncbi:MAG: FtsX-like permease family protein [Brevinematales bacterium]